MYKPKDYTSHNIQNNKINSKEHTQLPFVIAGYPPQVMAADLT